MGCDEDMIGFCWVFCLFVRHDIQSVLLFLMFPIIECFPEQKSISPKSVSEPMAIGQYGGVR